MGWHFTNPFFFMLVWSDVRWTILLTLAFEILEMFVLTIFRSFPVLFANPNDAETLAASYLGDIVIQGGLGVMAGYALHRLTAAPSLVPFVARGRAWYIALSFFPLLTSVFLTTATTTSGVRYGAVLQTSIVMLLVWLVYPLLMRAPVTSVSWTSQQRFSFFGLAGVGVLAANVPLFSDSIWFINQWYQMWLFLVPYVFLVLVAAAVVACSRSDMPELASTLGLMLTLTWFWLWFAYAATGRTSTALAVVGAIVLVGAIVAFIVGGALDQSSAVAHAGYVSLAHHTIVATPIASSTRRRTGYSFAAL